MEGVRITQRRRGERSDGAKGGKTRQKRVGFPLGLAGGQSKRKAGSEAEGHVRGVGQGGLSELTGRVYDEMAILSRR